jgi:phage/plasmid-like protein (TIGR03299 family)
MEQRIIDILDQSNLNWTVSQDPIYTNIGGEQIEIIGKKSLNRSDTKTSLDVMSSSYVPFQNHELIELLDKVSTQTGLELQRGGSFKDGRRVYVQLKSGDMALNGDKIEGFLTGINSFDGSTSLAFGPSNVTISCMNTFFAAFKSLETKIRHTKNMVIKIDDICREMDNLLIEEKNIFSDIKMLSETRFGASTTDDVIRKLFNVDKSMDVMDEKISTRTRNNINQFYVDLNGELQQKGDNLWGLFSGVTKYTTHSMSKKDSTEHKMFNEAYSQREKEIFADLVELV